MMRRESSSRFQSDLADRRKTFFLMSSKFGLEALPTEVEAASEGVLSALDEAEFGDEGYPASERPDSAVATDLPVSRPGEVPPKNRETPPSN